MDCLITSLEKLKMKISRPAYVIPGVKITKKTRQDLFGVGSVSRSKSMLFENFQRKAIEDGTELKCPKIRGMRINSEYNTLCIRDNPYSGTDPSYEWSEDFDGLQIFYNKYKIYYNFKSIVEQGGSQTRSLKCVYEFVKSQKNLIYNGKIGNNVFFANILDGEECSKNMDKFICFEKEEQIYVGDMYNYFDWLNKRLETIS